MNNSSNECCPQFRPEKWDGQSLSWANKQFIKDSMPTFFHIPFPPMIGKKITKMWESIEKAGAVGAKEDVLILFHDPSPFRSEILISVEHAIPGAENVILSGNFEAKVYDGGYNSVPKFLKLMDGELTQSGKKAKDYFIHYAYCPKCAEKFGHNYMILFAELQ